MGRRSDEVRLVTDRRPRESDRAWAAYCQYRNMEPEVRSISSAIVEVRGHLDLEWFKRWRVWSATFKWSDRVRSYDEERHERVRLQVESVREAARERRLAHAMDQQAVASARFRGLKEQIEGGQRPKMSVTEAIKMMANGMAQERVELGEEIAERDGLKDSSGVSVTVYMPDNGRDVVASEEKVAKEAKPQDVIEETA